MRLLLGFEAPQRGAVYYDGRDLSGVDASSVRRNIGVVLQDGKLFMGSIYDNISISAPGLTMDEAWKAAELAGIADDIRAMPMGMNTFVTETGWRRFGRPAPAPHDRARHRPSSEDPHVRRGDKRA